MVNEGRSVLEAAERALVAEVAGAERSSDPMARTSFTLVVRPQKRGRSAWMFRSRGLRGPVCWTPAQK